MRVSFLALILAAAAGCHFLTMAAAPSIPSTAPDRVKWEKMPLLTPTAAKAGVFPGGEGAQWPRGLVISPSQPDFLLLAIDVGGLYRTLDGGKFWQQASVGWNARGANAFAIDPKNTKRVIGIAGNSMDWNAGWGKSPNGLYLSTDQAGSWKQVTPWLDGDGGAVAFDPTSFDTAKGYCMTAYALAQKSGLWKSTDGGETWAKLSDDYADSRLVVEPKTGAVFIGGAGDKTKGLYRSADGGKTFTRILTDAIHGLDVAGDALYISGEDAIRKSSDGGQIWTALPTDGIDRMGKPILNIRVSPANPERMACWVQGDNWQWGRYTFDAVQKRWRTVTFDNTLAVLPNNVRQGYFVWHPKDAETAYGIGGDWVTKSTDGGKIFRWSANGYNGIMLGGMFNFSAHDPDTVFLAFQDYNGAFTSDGGKTWNYRDVSGKVWGGFCYGGYAVDKSVMWYGDAESWGGPRTLRVSQDGGTTWANAKDAETGQPAVFAGPDVSLSDPKDARILFASNWRSADKGQTWRKTAGCDGAYIAAPDGTLLGKKGNAIVRSTDHGTTWEMVTEVPGGFDDVAYDHERKRYYVASESRLKMFEGGAWTTLETPTDQYGGHRITTAAVDPVKPSVVYAGSHKDIYACNNAVVRSADAGKTWTNLNVNTPLVPGATDGPHEVSAIRVHPKTRYAWLNGQCYGMWKIAPP